MRFLRILCCLVTVISLGAGCGDDDAPDSDDTSAGDSDCAALIDRSSTLAELGSPSQEHSTDVGGLPACQAQVTGSTVGVDEVQVLQAPAEDWAKTLPDLIDQVLASDLVRDPAQRRKLERGREMVTSGDEVTAESACELFTTLVVSLQGLEEGAQSVVNVLPDSKNPLAVNGQACSDGTYTSVQIKSASALELDDALLSQVGAALDEYHDGPV